MSMQAVGGAGYIYDIVNLIASTQAQQAQALTQIAAGTPMTSDQLSNIQTAQSALDIRI
jgi:hypothetical protein